MIDFITFLLLLMGQPAQPPIEPEVSPRSGGIPIQPNTQAQPSPAG